MNAYIKKFAKLKKYIKITLMNMPFCTMYSHLMLLYIIVDTINGAYFQYFQYFNLKQNRFVLDYI